MAQHQRAKGLRPALQGSRQVPGCQRLPSRGAGGEQGDLREGMGATPRPGMEPASLSTQVPSFKSGQGVWAHMNSPPSHPPLLELCPHTEAPPSLQENKRWHWDVKRHQGPYPDVGYQTQIWLGSTSAGTWGVMCRNERRVREAQKRSRIQEVRDSLTPIAILPSSPSPSSSSGIAGRATHHQYLTKEMTVSLFQNQCW